MSDQLEMFVIGRPEVFEYQDDNFPWILWDLVYPTHVIRGVENRKRIWCFFGKNANGKYGAIGGCRIVTFHAGTPIESIVQKLENLFEPTRYWQDRSQDEAV